MTYEALLDVFSCSTVKWLQNFVPEEKRKEYIMHSMQELYPGNYKVEEYYDPSTTSFKYCLKFDTDQDEIWFKLKYG